MSDADIELSVVLCCKLLPEAAMKVGIADDAANVSGDIGALPEVISVAPLAFGAAITVPSAIVAGVAASKLAAVDTVFCGVPLTRALVGVVLPWATLLAVWLPGVGLVVVVALLPTFAGPDATEVQP